jgi:hypothetical protein
VTIERMSGFGIREQIKRMENCGNSSLRVLISYY